MVDWRAFGGIEIGTDTGPDGLWRVSQDASRIRVGGTPLSGLVVKLLLEMFSPSGPNRANAYRAFQKLLLGICNACWALEGVQPKGSLAAADAADRAFEMFTTLAWNSLNAEDQPELALKHALWVLRLTTEWEESVSPARVHKGTPYYFAGISAFVVGNLDMGLRLLESGDLEDSETYLRAGRSEIGVDFPGRLTLQLDPSVANYLQPSVLAMRAHLAQQLDEFNKSSGMPSGSGLVLDDVDRYLMKDQTSVSESRYLFGYLFWRDSLVKGSRYGWIPSSGILSRRRVSEWILGLLTATEGLVRRVVPRLPPPDHLSSVVARVAAIDFAGSHDPESVAKSLIKKGDVALNGKSIGDALDYWEVERKSNPSGPSGLPWYMGWIEPARFMRNKAAHLVGAGPEFATRWDEIDRTARFALFASIWLSKRKATTP